MPNDALREAMAAAELSTTALAEKCAVDAKTVGRWLGDERRVPHPRQRWAAAQALNTEVDVIWPSIRQAARRSPGLRVKRVGDGGVFTSYAAHVDALWHSARPAFPG